uniref:Uncharacterized protein n=1 Tax=Arundo donax TaxID=35708 RepID=A0A0A9C5W6_ARUDO
MAGVLGRSAGVGWLHASPSRSSRSAWPPSNAPSRRGSTASSARPSRWRLHTQSTSKWKPSMSQRGRRPQTTSRTTAPKA